MKLRVSAEEVNREDTHEEEEGNDFKKRRGVNLGRGRSSDSQEGESDLMISFDSLSLE